MGARYRSGWWIEVEYHGERLTQREIALLCDRCHPKAVRGELGFESELRDPLCD